ncbi:MAG: hypothetical protein R6X02_27390 [Enhygromyxa sp.]
MFAKFLSNTWTVFWGLALGLILLMVSVRPELQPRPGHEDAPGSKIAVAGHVLSWTTGAVLGYRMVRGVREANKRELAARRPVQKD